MSGPLPKRELGAYFTSPLAYVFIVIFLLLCGFFTFFVGGFFERQEASLVRPFFDWHPWFYLFLVPAVGMRLWAEERRVGTIELLLTMPITAWQAIVGKFLASWLFLALALVLTFPVVITVNYLGHPDNGVILTAYVGSWLMAGAYLAISCITSALTRSQVVSFIISLVVCLFLILAGFPPVINVLEQFAALAGGPGHVLQRDDPFRGLPERGARLARHPLLPVGHRVLALYDQCDPAHPSRRLRTGRHRCKRNRFRQFSIRPPASLVMLVILIAFNFIAGTARTRLDLTQEKAYTLSAGTRAILKKLDTPVTIRFYCTQSESATPETVFLKGYARKVEDLLAEYKQVAGGKLKIEKYDPQPDSDAEDSARLDGIEAQPLPGADRFYLGLAVKCADEVQSIPFLAPNRERLLEYDLDPRHRPRGERRRSRPSAS